MTEPTRDATAELVRALAKARGNFSRVEKDGTNPHLSNRYATLGAVLEAVTGPLLEAGIVVTQTPVPIEGGRWALQTTLRHEGGGELAGLVPLEYSEARGLNPMQSLGSAISYGRRYGLLAMLCLTAEDDDGATAGPPPSRKAEPAPSGRRPVHPPNGERANRPPRTGAELYARLKEKGRQDVLDLLAAWGDRQDPALPDRITAWPATAIPAAWTFALAEGRRLKAEDAELDRAAARDAGRN